MSDLDTKCLVCQNTFETKEIITLDCSHVICLICLHDYIIQQSSYSIKCFCQDCYSDISDQTIREILSESEITEFDKKSLRSLKSAHYCILPECRSPIIYSSQAIQYDCQSCSLFNCVACNAAHKWMTCEDYTVCDFGIREMLCQEEIERARKEFMKRMAEVRRESIIKSDNCVIIANREIFTCPICNSLIKKNMGVQLRQCFHNICQDCIKEHIMATQDIPTPCPIADCHMKLEDRESRELLSYKDLIIFEGRSLKMAKPKLDKPDQCRRANCTNFVDIIGELNNWTCTVCGSVNCLNCDAIHNNQSCNQFRDSRIDDKDQDQIEAMIKRKELMRCPGCTSLLQKTSGCNWIKCGNCNLELCWILQTYRWGPNGRNDISGGCRCGVGGKRCHPTCTGCIPHS